MIDDELDFTNTKSQLLFTPEGALFINILYMALEDYRKSRYYKSKLQPMGQRALEFLMSDNEIMQLNSWLLGIPLYKIQGAIMYDKELFTIFKRNVKLLINDIDDHLQGKDKDVEEDNDMDF
jgi:hypothetical protein